jgi:dolichol-phosphate mannosyltransferase
MTTTREPTAVATLDLTVVVPTRNEADNIAPLVTRLDTALAELRAEILFVDDSDDDTPDRVLEVASQTRHRVRLLHRSPGERAGGLGTAVLAGFQAADSRWAVVMDGDLQHPPELAPVLVRTGCEQDSEMVVASRYVGAGDSAGLSGAMRHAVSRSSTLLTRALFPRRMRSCSDPMSGMFAVRMERVDLAALRPNGFKILMEILARSPRMRVSEVPFTFGERLAGESKASLREGALFARRLIGLRAATLFGRHSARAARAAGFAAVGATGIAVNTFALWAFVQVLGMSLLWAAALATQASTLWNFALTDRYVFRGPKSLGAIPRLIGFAAVNNAALLLRLPLLHWFTKDLHVHYLAANVTTLLIAFAVRFAVSDRYLFNRREPMTDLAERPTQLTDQPIHEFIPQRSGPVDLVVDIRPNAAPPIHRMGRPLLYRYDVHGIVRISSAVRLAELDSFRTECEFVADIEIDQGWFGTGTMRGRPRVTQYVSPPAVSYEEHLGRHGSDFHVDMGNVIRVVAGPMLTRSPHVLYTNVIEALLRFVLVSRGYMLLHSACLDIGGRGVMLSALTDTGKTGTVLRLLREGGGRFLSDDMTILDSAGVARCYPKPLTISHHTLRAVQAGDLTRAEWRRLHVQSRVHSKAGRGVGARLGELNLPIMSINAVTQRIVKPPKYTVQRLVSCEQATHVQVDTLFVIERKDYGLSDIGAESLIDELIANTDDAYGFPPFRYFAPALVVDGFGYEELRAKERAILTQAMAGIRARRLATPDYSWWEHISQLVRDDSQGPVVAPEPNHAGESLIPQNAIVPRPLRARRI